MHQLAAASALSRRDDINLNRCGSSSTTSFGAVKTPRRRALSKRHEHFKTAIENSVSGLPSIVGATNFAATGSGKRQSVNRRFCVCGKRRRGWNLSHKTVANHPRAAGRNSLGPWTLRRVFLQSRQCLLRVGDAANRISFVWIDGDNLRRSLRTAEASA